MRRLIMKTSVKNSLIGFISLLGMFVAAACSPAQAATSTPQSTSLPPVKSSTAVVVEGKVVPVRHMEISFRSAGIVEEVMFEEGQAVGQGQVIARLTGSEKTAAEITAAKLDLQSAKNDLATLQNNAAVDLAQAKMTLAEAEKELDKATTQRASKEYRIGSDTQIDVADADVIVAREQVSKAKDAFTSVQGFPETDPIYAGAKSNLAAAQQKLDRALANYNYLLKKPDPFEVNLAQARLELAQANVDAARAAVERFSKGPDAAKVQETNLRIASVEARLKASNATLDDLVLKAPFGGVLVKMPVQAGEMVSPGSPTLVLADLSSYQVELVNLTEIQVGRIRPGQAVTIKVDALPELELNGKVSRINEMGENYQGDIVYKTIVTLDEQAPDLRWNMSVSAEIKP
jgi:HlyD family secretion protein